MLSPGFGAAAMFAGDFAAGTVGNMLNRAISGERQNLGESLWEGTLNAVGNAVFVKDPIGSLKGAGKKPINGFRDVFRKGAEAAGVTTLMNDLAQMSGIVGGGEEQDSGSRYSSTLSRRTIGLDISANTRGKQDPRTLCEPSDAFGGGIGSQSTRDYRQTGGSGRNKRKSRFNLGKLAGDVIVNSLLGGFTSTMYYGADRAVGAVSNGIRGRWNSKQKIAGNDGTPTIKNQIQGLKSQKPQQLLDFGWQDITDPRMAANTTSMDLYNPKTGLRIRFDAGVEGAFGFEAVDHYHVYNNNYTNKKTDFYFDIDGNMVGKGSKASHIVIGSEK